MLEKKEMSKKEWKRVEKREYVYETINNRKGAISILSIEKVKKPCYKVYSDNEEIKIADDGYYWMQLAFSNANWWLTVMFDKDKNIIQYYFDITEKNVINSNEAYFYDLFLDVVCLNNGKIILLDAKELDEALEQHEINQKQYKLAKSQARQIIESLKINKDRLDKFCYNKFNTLICKMKKNEEMEK